MIAIVGRPGGRVAEAIAQGLAKSAAGPIRFVCASAPAPAPETSLERAVARPDSPLQRTQALADVSALVFLPSFDRSMVELQLALAREARAAGIQRIVHISLIGADARSPVELLRRIGLVERACNQSGLAHLILRCTPFMQNLDFFLRDDCGERCLIGPFREARFCWIDAHDVGEIVGKLLAAPALTTLTTQLCGPETLNFDAAAQAISEASGTECGFWDVSQQHAHGMLEVCGFSAERARTMLEYWDYLVSGVVGTTPCPTAAKLLGRPLHTLREHFQELQPA
jgi:uncharacterized protein YbjT (DUF2867 family)